MKREDKGRKLRDRHFEPLPAKTEGRIVPWTRRKGFFVPNIVEGWTNSSLVFHPVLNRTYRIELIQPLHFERNEAIKSNLETLRLHLQDVKLDGSDQITIIQLKNQILPIPATTFS